MLRYGVAVAIYACALYAGYALPPAGSGHGFLIFYPAVMLSLLVCGVGPGLSVLGLSSLSGYLLYTPPLGVLGHHPAADLPVLLFLCSGLLVGGVVANLHAYADRLRIAHDALSAVERRLYSIADHVPMGIVYVDRDDRVQFANREFRQVNGRDEDPRGMAAREYLNPALYERTAEVRGRALAGERVQFTVRVVVGGVGRWREVSCIPELDDAGQVCGCYVLGYDVTEREALSAQLRQARADLEAILDNVPARITSWHGDFTNRFANRGAEQALGLAHGAARGMHLREVIGVQAYELEQPMLYAALAGESQTREHEERGPDGVVHYRQITYVPQWHEGRVVGLYALETDITELRRSFERVRQLAQRLESVREDERRAVAQLLHEGLAQELFAARMAISHIEGRTKSMTELAPAWRELEHAITRSIAATRQLANDLRPSALAHLRVSAALKEHARYFGEVADLAIDVKEVAPFPVLDESTRLVLFRAAQEALTNVARHANANLVRVSLRVIPGAVRMEVSDNGRSFRVRKTLLAGNNKRLGLVGMKERVEMIGGTFTLESTLGQGTTVRADLPFTPNQQKK